MLELILVGMLNLPYIQTIEQDVFICILNETSHKFDCGENTIEDGMHCEYEFNTLVCETKEYIEV